MAFTSSLPGTPLVEASNGEVPTDVVLGIDAAGGSTAKRIVSAGHAGGFTSCSFTIDGVLDDHRLQGLFDSFPSSLLRARGILRLSSRPDRRTICQRVGARWRYTCRQPATAAIDASEQRFPAVADD